MLTSTNGTNWDFHSTDVDQDLKGIAYGNGVFVAVGHAGRAATSLDGATWTEQETGTSASFNSVRFVNGHFLGSASSGRILHSPDGVEWTEYLTPSTNYWNDVVFFKGKYVFVGWDYKTATARYGVTTNFQDWDIGYTGYGRYLDRVIIVEDKLTAVGYAGAAQSSADGIHWDPAVDANSRWLFDALLVNGTVVAIGESGAIATYRPDEGWTSHESGTDESFRGIAFGNDTFVAVGDNGTIRQSDAFIGGSSGVTLLTPVRDGTNFKFQLTGETGQSYQIQATTDFVNWTPVMAVLCDSSPTQCTLTQQALGNLYYRAVKP